MSTSSTGRAAGLLGAIGGVVWIVWALAVMGDEPVGIMEWVPVVALALMTIGVIGLYLRSSFASTGILTVALLFLGYLIATVGATLLALSADGWVITMMGIVLALIGATAFGVYASLQRWGRPWTLIMAVLGVLNLVITLPLVFGLGGVVADDSTSMLVLQIAFFGGMGLNALLAGMLAMIGATQEAPPVLPAI